jgi:hypothetical protein
MYFWNIEALKSDIRNNQLTEKIKFIYALIYIGLSTIALELTPFMSEDNINGWDIMYSISSILIVIVGTIMAYKANGGPNGNEFLGKYFSISFVLSIRFLVLLIPLFIAMIAYYSIVFSEVEQINSSFIDTVPYIIWYAALYWRICYHIENVK